MTDQETLATNQETATAPVQRFVSQLETHLLKDATGAIVLSDWNPVSGKGHAAVSDDCDPNDTIWYDEVIK